MVVKPPDTYTHTKTAHNGTQWHALISSMQTAGMTALLVLRGLTYRPMLLGERHHYIAHHKRPYTSTITLT